MLVALSWPVALAIDVALWVIWSVAIGWWAAQRPVASLGGDGRLLRVRGFEWGGRWYERRLGVRRWKDALPEAGTWFGGLSKRHLPGAAEGGLARFRAECVRAEVTHWLALAPIVVFALWTPWWLLLALATGALASNLPCIVVLRYNRARLEAIAARRHTGRA